MSQLQKHPALEHQAIKHQANIQAVQQSQPQVEMHVCLQARLQLGHTADGDGLPGSSADASGLAS